MREGLLMRFRVFILLLLAGAAGLLVATAPTGRTQSPGENKGGKGKKTGNFEQWAEREFKDRDRDGDGFLDRDEVPGRLRDEFERWDANKDGKIDLSEFRRHL